MLYSYNHDQLYKHIIHIHLPMHAEHNDTMKTTSDTVLLEKYTSHFIERLCVRRSWKPNRTAYWPPLYWPYPLFFSVLLCCSTGGLGAHSAGCWLSLRHLVTNGSGLQTAWHPVFTKLYNSSTSTFLWASQLHSFNPSTAKVIILIFLDRMHLLFT